MRDFSKIKSGIIRCFSLTAILLLAACGLPVVTPPVATQAPSETSIFSTNVNSPTSTEAPIPSPVEITSKNAAALTVVNRAPANTIQKIMWAKDGLSLAVSTQNTDIEGAQLFGVSVLDIPTLAPINVMSTKDARVADLSSDGRLAALVSLDMTTISLVDLSAGNAVELTIIPDFLVGSATFSPDGSTLAVAKADEWKVVVYSTSEGSEVNTLTGFETAAPVYNAGFKESPQWIVWHARATLKLQEIESGVFGPALEHQDFVNSYVMTRDGSMMATDASTAGVDAAIRAVTLWDVNGGNVLRTFELTETPYCLDFSPNGTLLAMGVGSSLQIWDVTSGSMLASLDGHAAQITALAFSADGKFIATAGNDNQLFLWQASE